MPSHIGHEQRKTIVDGYDTKSLYSIWKWHFFTNEEYNLDTFETTNSTSKPSKELMNKELSIFQGYEIDAKDIKYLLQ